MISWRTTMPHNYVIEIISSDEDEGFIAVVSELPGLPSARPRRRRSGR